MSRSICSRCGLKLTIRFINSPHFLSTFSRACCRRGHRHINPILELYWWPSPLKALFHASSPRETPTTVVGALEKAPGFSRALGSTPARSSTVPDQNLSASVNRGASRVPGACAQVLLGQCFCWQVQGCVSLHAPSAFARLSVMSRFSQCWMREERHGLEYLLTLQQELESRESRT